MQTTMVLQLFSSLAHPSLTCAAGLAAMAELPPHRQGLQTPPEPAFAMPATTPAFAAAAAAMPAEAPAFAAAAAADALSQIDVATTATLVSAAEALASAGSDRTTTLMLMLLAARADAPQVARAPGLGFLAWCLLTAPAQDIHAAAMIVQQTQHPLAGAMAQLLATASNLQGRTGANVASAAADGAGDAAAAAGNAAADDFDNAAANYSDE